MPLVVGCDKAFWEHLGPLAASWGLLLVVEFMLCCELVGVGARERENRHPLVLDLSV